MNSPQTHVPDSREDATLVRESLWSRIKEAASKVKVNRTPRSLKIRETLSLGEKRLLLIVECEHKRFLIGATAQNVSLLETLDAEPLPEHESA